MTLVNKDALRKLIMAVGAGTIPPHDLDAFIPALGLNTTSGDAHMAYRGSLDAALRAHEVLAPDCGYHIYSSPSRDYWIATVFRPEGGTFREWVASSGNNPARALLLADLKYVKAAAPDQTGAV